MPLEIETVFIYKIFGQSLLCSPTAADGRNSFGEDAALLPPKIGFVTSHYTEPCQVSHIFGWTHCCP